MPSNTEWTIDLQFEESGQFETTFEEAETFNTTMDRIVEIVTSDHRKLQNRDAEDQHPIGAITNLAAELQVRTDAPISNLEIWTIIQS